MHDVAPTVYLLAGLPGAGQATYAKALESAGVVRLVVDDETGQPLADLNERLVGYVEAGRDVVLDHGLDQAEERAFYKQLVEEHGGQWCVMHLTVDHTDLIKRLEQRAAGVNSVPVTEDALARMISMTQVSGVDGAEGEVIAPQPSAPTGRS